MTESETKRLQDALLDWRWLCMLRYQFTTWNLDTYYRQLATHNYEVSRRNLAH